MNIRIMAEILEAIGLLITLSFFQILIYRRFGFSSVKRRISTGLLFGVVAIAGMASPITTQNGVFFDPRSIVICLSSVFGGPIASGISVLMSSYYRYLVGGIGANIGIIVIVVSAAMGLIFSRIMKAKGLKETFFAHWTLGLFVHIVTLLLLLLLPFEVAFKAIANVGLAFILIFPIAQALLAHVLRGMHKKVNLEKNLQYEQVMTQASIDALNDTYFLFDPETGKALRWNKAFNEVSGYTDDEIASLPAPQSYYSDEDLIKAKDAMQRVVTEGEARIELPLICKDGQTVPFEYSVSIVSVESKNYMISIGRNMTDRRIAEDKLRRARDEAESANKAKSEFLATMSHEIRTPMNVVIGISDILLDSASDENQKFQIQKLQDASISLLELINNILDLTRMQANKIHLHKTNFNLVELVRKVINFYGQPFAEKKIKLMFQVDKGVPNLVCADSVRIRQVLVNLISNALKFTNEGEVKVCLGIETSSDNFIHFRISDTGIGLDIKHSESIFDQFFQIDSGLTRRYAGTGLGLSISKQLVEQMGGRIWLESANDMGTTFHFVLPIDVIESDVVCEQYVEVSETHLPPVEGKEKPLKILLVEDSVDNCYLIKAFLKNSIHCIDTAENGAIAVQAVQNNDYDLILMDMQMPVMDGYSATAAIREWESQNSRHPIIILALTAHALQGDMEKSLKAGCDDHITKPIKKDCLLNYISKYSYKLSE